MDGREFAERIPISPLDLIRRWPWDTLPLTHKVWQAAEEMRGLDPKVDAVVNGIVSYSPSRPGIVTIRREGQADGRDAVVTGVTGFRLLHGTKIQAGLMRRHGQPWWLDRVYGIRGPMQADEPEGFVRGIIENIGHTTIDGRGRSLLRLRTGEGGRPLVISQPDTWHIRHLYAAVGMLAEHIPESQDPVVYRRIVGEPGDEASKRFMYIPPHEVYLDGVPEPGSDAFTGMPPKAAGYPNNPFIGLE